MLDFSNKEFVRSFTVSNLRENRTVTREVVILGRTYIKHGTACATTMVTDCWKVWDPSVERFKYVYLGGVARQHPYDAQVKYSDGVEIAHENAMMNPVFKLVYDEPISYELVEAMMAGYIAGLPVQLIKTKQEKEMENYNPYVLTLKNNIPDYVADMPILYGKHIGWLLGNYAENSVPAGYGYSIDEKIDECY